MMDRNEKKERLEKLISLKQQDIDNETQTITKLEHEIEALEEIIQIKDKQIAQRLDGIHRRKKAIQSHTRTMEGHKIVLKDLKKKKEDMNWGFDDELFKNFDTVDIMMTDPNHSPKANQFYSLIKQKCLDPIKKKPFNPKKEQRKYNYDKLEKLRESGKLHHGSLVSKLEED